MFLLVSEMALFGRIRSSCAVYMPRFYLLLRQYFFIMFLFKPQKLRTDSRQKNGGSIGGSYVI